MQDKEMTHFFFKSYGSSRLLRTKGLSFVMWQQQQVSSPLLCSRNIISQQVNKIQVLIQAS